VTLARFLPARLSRRNAFGSIPRESEDFIMFGIGPSEMILVGLFALLLFGNRVPEVMRSLGRGVSEFKKGISGIEEEIRQVGDQRPGA
jgi:TatA/E family protein of Tat protein translocase